MQVEIALPYVGYVPLMRNVHIIQLTQLSTKEKEATEIIKRIQKSYLHLCRC